MLQQLLTGAVNTTNNLTGAIPTGQVAQVLSITYHQAAGAVAKTVNLGFADVTTAANVRRSIPIPAGQASGEIYPGFVIPAGASLHYAATAGANECLITVNIDRQIAT